MTVNKESQLEPCPCYDCSTIEGESAFSTSRNIRVIQWYLGYHKFILYQHTFLLLYTIMDDILLFTPTKESHFAKLEDLLKALCKNGLKISPKKSQLFKTEL